MIGAGVFAAIGPAAEAAGAGLLIGLAIAAVVAFCNATSSAQLAAVYPASGGTYVYGRERLGPFWGYLAGWGFVVGKTASCAAMALTVGAYAAPSWQRPIAVAAVVALTAVNYFGVRKTALLTRVIVASCSSRWRSSSPAPCSAARRAPTTSDDLGIGGVGGILRSARAAVLRLRRLRPHRHPRRGGRRSGPHDPEGHPARARDHARRLPVVAVSALAAVGPTALAESDAPLATAVRAGDLDALVPAVRIGGAVAALGVLLSLIAGVSRTTFAMAPIASCRGGSTPSTPPTRSRTAPSSPPARWCVVLVSLTDLRGAIGFSSFCVLTYYAIANAAAWTLPRSQRRWPRALAVAGLVGCATLAVTLPVSSVVTGACVLAVGALARAARRRVLSRPAAAGGRARRRGSAAS